MIVQDVRTIIIPLRYSAGCILLLIALLLAAGCVVPVPVPPRPTLPPTEVARHLSTALQFNPVATEENASFVTVTYDATVTITNEDFVNTSVLTGYAYINPPAYYAMQNAGEIPFRLGPLEPGSSASVKKTLNITLTREQYSRITSGGKYYTGVYINGYTGTL
jgi:hypothetical protein